MKSSQGNLATGIVMVVSPSLSFERQLADFGEAMAYHAEKIRPTLLEFDGYQDLKVTIKRF